MAPLRLLPLLALPLFAVACASANDDVGAGMVASNLDTSGCSGVDAAVTQGPVEVSAERPPTASCWNVDESGLAIGYAWTQDSATSTKDGLSAWVSLNGASATVKADAADCEAWSEIVLGPDTSGAPSYTCTAWARVDFAHNPDLKAAAYGANGDRLPWDVRVAVALPDGTWDSLNGANYHFSL